MSVVLSRNEQVLIWDYYKPRHTHAWNMLVLSWRELDHLTAKLEESEDPWQIEYFWENFILRLWLYRTTVNTLTKLDSVKGDAQAAISKFDAAFQTNGDNGLKALRNMIEHFDDYAAGKGRGPATRAKDLDPWRSFTKDRYERGQFALDRTTSFGAADNLRSEAKVVSDKFIKWYWCNE